MKVLRHPCILQYFDGVDLDKDTLIVTEPVIPLKAWLSTLTGDRKEEQVRSLQTYNIIPSYSSKWYLNVDDNLMTLSLPFL